ncbi:MAG: hypothetical protein ACT4TC_23965, partial [Myxococcaceae bacterium]
MRFHAPAAVAFLLLSCAHTGSPYTRVLDTAATDLAGGKGDARTFALAGFHAYLVEANPKKAQALFDSAVAQNAADPYALAGQLTLARRSAQLSKALEIALDLCQRAPTHPLASTAARFVLDQAGSAIPLDEIILRRSEASLAAGAQGDAAQLLRSAMATIHGQRGSLEPQAEQLAAMGVPTQFSLVGPLSPFQVLSFDDVTAPEKDGSLAGPFQGPFGAVTVRTLTFPDGRLNLAAESQDGDVYLAAVDARIAQGGLYVVRSVTNAPHKVYVDGTRVLEKRSFATTGSTVQAAGVTLGSGVHRLLVKLSKDDRAGTLSLALMRADGKPSAIAFSPAQGASPNHGSISVQASVPGVFPDTASQEAALKGEAGDALAAALAVRDGMGRDRDGAKRGMAPLSAALTTPAIASLRAELNQGDRTVPSKVSKGRAARDVEATLEKDPGDVNALLLGATLALDDSRLPEAAELIKRARAALSPAPFPIALLQARVDLALGVEAQADQSALEALKAQPGLCEAEGLRYDLARRRDAVALADQLVVTL